RCSRRNCTRRVRGSTSPVTALPFTVSATADMAFLLEIRPKTSFFAPTGETGGGPGQNRVDFAPGHGLEQVDSEPSAHGRSRVWGLRLCRSTASSSRLRHRRGELHEEIVGGLLRRAVDETLPELGELATDLRLHVIGEKRAAVVVGERHLGTAFGKAGNAPLPFAGNAIAVRRI